MYRRQTGNKHQLVVPKTLFHHIKVNHDPVYVSHPSVKRTWDLISLNYWWPGMHNSIKDYVKVCDVCQRRKEERQIVAPLGDVYQPSVPIDVISKDITGPYVLTPQKNKICSGYTNQRPECSNVCKGLRKPNRYQKRHRFKINYCSRSIIYVHIFPRDL